jgi:hypothetical protein
MTFIGDSKRAPNMAAELRCKKCRRESRAPFISNYRPNNREHRG